MLRALDKLDVSLELLKAMPIAKHVADLRKGTTSADVSKLAKKLRNKWKALAEASESSTPPKAAASQAEKPSSAAAKPSSSSCKGELTLGSQMLPCAVHFGRRVAST